MHGRGVWFALCQAQHLDGAITGCRYDTQGGAKYLSWDRCGNGADGGGEDFGGSHVRHRGWQGFRIGMYTMRRGWNLPVAFGVVLLLGGTVLGADVVSRAHAVPNILRSDSYFGGL
jgi:hypothetical protein